MLKVLMPNMRLIEATRYLQMSIKEGYFSQEEADELIELHYPEFIKKVSAMAERGDYYANEI